jgi:hypothetical protein
MLQKGKNWPTGQLNAQVRPSSDSYEEKRMLAASRGFQGVTVTSNREKMAMLAACYTVQSVTVNSTTQIWQCCYSCIRREKIHR